MPTIAFMHVGANTQQATLMARSFRAHNPDFRIVQVSDRVSPMIDGVDDVVRSTPTDRNIMLFRMRCFAGLPTDDATWFLDTDMLCARPLRLEGEDVPIAVCLREFDRDLRFNHRFNGMDLSEYAGRTLGSIYPYVGCATYLRNASFWQDCLRNMEALDPKFYNWYGDQEAIRNMVNSGKYRTSVLPESLYACLPEKAEQHPNAYIFHYKGQRKAKMLERARADGLL